MVAAEDKSTGRESLSSKEKIRNLNTVLQNKYTVTNRHIIYKTLTALNFKLLVIF